MHGIEESTCSGIEHVNPCVTTGLKLYWGKYLLNQWTNILKKKIPHHTHLLGMAECRGIFVPLRSRYNHSQWSSGQTDHPQHSYETWDVHGQNLGDANIWFPMKHRKKSRLILKNYLTHQYSETSSQFVTLDGIRCSIDSISNAVMIEIINYGRGSEMD